MRAANIHGLIRRRGNVIQWLHALPPDPSTIDDFTGGPKASLGAPGSDRGPFGETYLPAADVKGYLSNKAAAVTFQAYGIVEVGDLQVDFAVPFMPEPGVDPLPPTLLAAYNAGNFAVVFRQGEEREKTVAFDRFVILGQTYVAKARPVPVTDNNQVVAWRLLVGEVSI